VPPVESKTKVKTTPTYDGLPIVPGKTRKPRGKFAKVPKIIRIKGRSAGFVSMRDKMLKDWEFFATAARNPLAVLKTIIELDRHAMFSEVQASKQSTFNDEQYIKFQKYLEGDVDSQDKIEDKEIDKAVDVIDALIEEHAVKLDQQESEEEDSED
jgi:hypothetical protein